MAARKEGWAAGHNSAQRVFSRIQQAGQFLFISENSLRAREPSTHQSGWRGLCVERLCRAMATPPAAPVAVMTDHALQMHSEDIGGAEPRNQCGRGPDA